MADGPRRTYAERAGEIVTLIDSINQRGNDPHHLHEAKDAAKRKARALQMALESDGL